MLVVADQDRLRLTPWNMAYGNKIAHLLFLVSLCAQADAELVIPCASCLDELFVLDRYKHSLDRAVPCAFREESAFDVPVSHGLLARLLRTAGIGVARTIGSVVARSKQQMAEEAAFLARTDLPPAFTVTGHFWHYPLMPDLTTFSRFIQIRKEVLAFMRGKYPDLDAPRSVAVHLRDTDFRQHLGHLFSRSILLDDAYYLRAAALIEGLVGRDVRYHLFSDNKQRVIRLFRGKNYVVHDDSPACDWVGLFLARNIIQSNSTFCWTAALYNKTNSIQPAGGYGYHHSLGNVPCGFLMPFSDVIDAAGHVTVRRLK